MKQAKTRARLRAKHTTQLTFTCSQTTIETQEKGKKYVLS